MSEKIPYWLSKKCPLSKRGVEPKYTKISDEDIKAIISMYESGEHTYKSISDHFKRHPSSIGDILNKRGYTAVSLSVLTRKYKINDNYFETIDTEGKAYFLGFIYADGYNCVNNFELIIGLQPRDSYILHDFLKEMGSNHPIKTKSAFTKGKNRTYTKVCIGNKKISLDLEKHGCMQKKSFDIRFPETVPYNLIHHFVRGYFDGDGCFFRNQIFRSNMGISITSNKIFLRQMQAVLITELGLNETKISTASNSRQEIGVLVYSGRNNCIKLRDWMYKDASFFLTRKFDKLYSI